jgi:serine phosphatase RsbU (regulator of sigma subunit)
MFRAVVIRQKRERTVEKAFEIRNKRQDRKWISGKVVQRRPGSLGGVAELVRRNRALEDEHANLRRDHDHLRRTLYEAAHAQRRLCGPRQLRRGSLELADEIFPVHHLSGDFISVFEFEDDLVFAIGDITGKGLAAGMWFTYLVGVMQLQFASLGDPAAAVGAMNRDLLRMGGTAPLSTLLLVRLKANDGEISYCNAGHPPALLLHSNGQSEALSRGGPVLGALHQASFVNGKATLQPGDTLLGYSDGILECRNASGAEFGVERVLDTVRHSCGFTASATLFSVLAAVEGFAGNRTREDDMALIVVHRASQ